MAIPPPPAGWTRLQLKSKFGAGRDFVVLDPETEEQRYYVDGHMGTRPKAEVQDAAGKDVYSIRGSLLGIPKHMTITNADGEEVAWLKAKTFSPIKTKMNLEVASGEPWALEGNFIEKNYSITSGGDADRQHHPEVGDHPRLLHPRRRRRGGPRPRPRRPVGRRPLGRARLARAAPPRADQGLVSSRVWRPVSRKPLSTRIQTGNSSCTSRASGGVNSRSRRSRTRRRRATEARRLTAGRRWRPTR